MPQDDEHLDSLELWEEAAFERVRFLLQDSEWDEDQREVRIPSEEAGGHCPTFTSLDEFRTWLVGEFISVWSANQPNDAAYDSKGEIDAVNEALEDYAEQVESLGWEL